MLEVISNLNNPVATNAKPKERQFQVVPVPAIFTRGRWECRDYKEAPNFLVTSSHSGVMGMENGAHPAMVGPVGDYIDKPILTPSPQGDIPSTIPLMRNDAKNVAAAQGVGAGTVTAILPDKLPTPSAVENSDNPLVGSFAPQPPQDDANKELFSVAGNVSSNQVAIDNKIEQAMDLVKTHLTFAVREEVEQLRTQISELESRVNNLEGENQILRQFAPPEIVANLPLLLQNSQHQQNGQQQQHKSSLPPQQHSAVALSGFENTNASIPSVSSAPVLTTMTGLPASTVMAGSSANNNTSVASVTHTISTAQSTPSASAMSMGGATLHIGDSATPSPPPAPAGSELPPGDPQHYHHNQSPGSPTAAGASKFVVTSTRPSTPAAMHNDEFQEF